jgi:hypothetical protein
MWNCGEAIQVVSDAVVRNNLILNSTNGITAAPQLGGADEQRDDREQHDLRTLHLRVRALVRRPT